MELPEALRPWAADLRIFPREIALSLGPLLRRLGPLIGPLRRLRHSGDGEVDGFDGLSHRGSYERLVMTEWLLADEAPEEFLRRAGTGEHTFLRLARPEPGGSRSSVALFDAGPSQIGSPRVVHLAALLVLARRASEAGARFSWGILQQRDAPLFAEVSARTLLRLIEARTSTEATEADSRAWQARTGAPKLADDLWLVGGRRLASSPAAHQASCLVVDDVLDPASRRVTAAVRQRMQALGEATLDLPDKGAVARLLRDPFGVVSAPPTPSPSSSAPTSNLVFSANGVKLFARAPGGGIVEYPVPNSPRMRVGAPKRRQVTTPQPVVAVGRIGRSFTAITTTPRGFELHSNPEHATRRKAESYELAYAGSYRIPDELGPLQPCYALSDPSSSVVKDGAEVDLVFLDGDGTLLRLLSQRDGRRLAVVMAAGVTAATPIPGGALFVERLSSASWRVVRIQAGVRRQRPLSGGAAFLGFGGSMSDAEWGLLAVGDGEGAFTVCHARGASRIAVPAGMRVLGVVRNLRRDDQPGLLALDPDARTLIQVGQSWTRRLPPASGPIEHVALSPAAAQIAYATVAGEVAIYSLDHDALLNRLLPGEP